MIFLILFVLSILAVIAAWVLVVWIHVLIIKVLCKFLRSEKHAL